MIGCFGYCRERATKHGWCAMVVHGFADAPTSWRSKEHGYLLDGDNVYTFVVFGDGTYWLYYGLGSYDGCPWPLLDWTLRWERPWMCVTMMVRSRHVACWHAVTKTLFGIFELHCKTTSWVVYEMFKILKPFDEDTCTLCIRHYVIKVHIIFIKINK